MSAGVGRARDRFIVYGTSVVLLAAAAATFNSASAHHVPSVIVHTSHARAIPVALHPDNADFGLF
jgi:hypothetical protein